MANRKWDTVARGRRHVCYDDDTGQVLGHLEDSLVSGLTQAYVGGKPLGEYLNGAYARKAVEGAIDAAALAPKPELFDG